MALYIPYFDEFKHVYVYDLFMQLVVIQCHWNYIEVRKFNYMLEIEIFRNFSKNVLGILRGDF